MQAADLMTVDRDILGGTPVFKGTRVPVKSLYDHFKLGYSIDEFLDAFPTVEREQVERLLDELERELPAPAGKGGG